MERQLRLRRFQEVRISIFLPFIGFAPAANPQILGMCVIYNPQGVYYGGTIAAPVIRDIFDNIFPYLGIEKDVEMQYTN